jgi:hypothetical protein
MEDEEWIDLNTVASPYDEQLNPRTGLWRHRPRQLRSPALGDRMLTRQMECHSAWQPGRAPR